MLSKNEIIIIGGGLAGLVCAIHLRKLGRQVLIIEKHGFPRHKVCGEYVSNEVLPYLNWLDCDLSALKPTQIKRLSLSSKQGKTIDCTLPLGGFGISRYALDHFLCEKAKLEGCEVLKDSAVNVTFQEDSFVVDTNNSGQLTGRLVIGAYGKRSGIDQKQGRSFLFKKSPWLAVKAHYKGQFPDDLVALHTFEGGYCGISKVENDRINICYLTDYQSFKIYKNISTFQQQVLYENPHLKQVFQQSTPLFDQPISIGQISFENKEQVYNHMLLIGDTAGLIHPLCGNGMAMAIHSAKICAELSSQFFEHKIERGMLERQYQKMWNENFKNRLFAGKIVSGMIRNKKLFNPLSAILVRFPSLLPLIVQKTHGKPIS